MRAKYGMDLTKGPIVRKLLIFCIPVILSSILQQLFNTADQIVAGQLIGDTALASVGSTSSLYALLLNFFIGLSTGTTVICAKHKGAGSESGVRNSVSTGISLALLSGGIVFVIGQLFCKQLLVATAVPPYLEEFAELYMRVIFIGTPFQLLYNFGAGILRASGDTKRPLYILTAGGALNVVLNLVLVLVLPASLGDKRVIGVAIGTVASHVFSSLFVVIILIRSRDWFHLNIKKLRLFKKHLIEILKVGIPTGFSSIAFSIANVIIQSAVNSFASTAAQGFGLGNSLYRGVGRVAPAAVEHVSEPFKAGVVLSGVHAATNIDNYMFLMASGINVGVISFTGQNYGAKNYKRIDETLIKAVIIALIGFSAIALPLYFFGGTFLQIYTSTPKAIEFAVIKTSVLAIGYYFYIPGLLTGGVLKGIEHSSVTMVIDFFLACGTRLIWIFFFYPLRPTLQMLFYAYPLSWTLVSIAHIIAYLIIRRKLHGSLASPEQKAEQ